MSGVKEACSGAKNFAGVSCCGCRGVEMGMRGSPREKEAGEGGSPVLSHLVRGKSEWCEERPLASQKSRGWE